MAPPRSTLRSLAACLAVAMLFGAGYARAGTWQANCDAKKQVPPMTEAQVGGATAVFTMTANLDSETATWQMEISSVVNLTMAHIHIGNAEENGNPLVILVPEGGNMTDGNLPVLAEPFSGSMTMSNIQFTADDFLEPMSWEEFLEAAQTQGLYVNLHTTEFPNGAIRGQLEPASISIANATLDAANQVPPLTPGDVAGAVGSFSLYSEGINYMYYLEVADIEEMTMSHIHLGNATTNGPPLVILAPADVEVGPNGSLPTLTPPKSGKLEFRSSFNTSALINITVAEFESFLSNAPQDNLYVNVHTVAYPNGAIRGQLTSATPPSPTPSPTPAPGPSPTPAPAPAPSAAAPLRYATALLAAALAAAVMLLA